MHIYSGRPVGASPDGPSRAADDGLRVSDATWARIGPLLPPRPPHLLGCHNPRVPDRRALDAILLVMRTGCRWNDLNVLGPCSSTSAFRRSREWLAAGVFEALEAMAPDDRATVGLDWSRLAPRASRRRATGPIEG